MSSRHPELPSCKLNTRACNGEFGWRNGGRCAWTKGGCRVAGGAPHRRDPGYGEYYNVTTGAPEPLGPKQTSGRRTQSRPRNSGNRPGKAPRGQGRTSGTRVQGRTTEEHAKAQETFDRVHERVKSFRKTNPEIATRFRKSYDDLAKYELEMWDRRIGSFADILSECIAEYKNDAKS